MLGNVLVFRWMLMISSINSKNILSDICVNNSLKKNSAAIIDENGLPTLLSTVLCTEFASTNTLGVIVWQSCVYSSNLEF